MAINSQVDSGISKLAPRATDPPSGKLRQDSLESANASMSSYHQGLLDEGRTFA